MVWSSIEAVICRNQPPLQLGCAMTQRSETLWYYSTRRKDQIMYSLDRYASVPEQMRRTQDKSADGIWDTCSGMKGPM